MPRKAFLADLAGVSKVNDIPGVSNIVKGDEDGMIEFTFTPMSSGAPIVVAIIASDVSEYPGLGNMFFLSSSTPTAPQEVHEVLQDRSEASYGNSIEDLIASLSTALRKFYKVDASGDVEMEDASDFGGQEVDEEDTDEFEWGYETDTTDGLGCDRSTTVDPKTAAKMNGRILRDLQAAKQAGFKVGIINGMTAESANSILSLSIRVSKLGLSDEAMQAWDLKKEQYVILLIRYTRGCKDFDFIMENGVDKHSNGIEFRVGICTRYKPTRVEAMAAFSEVKKDSKDDENKVEDPAKLSGYTSLFISSSLNDLMNSKLIPMMKCRQYLDITWDGAKHVYNDQQGKASGEYPNHLPDEYFDFDADASKDKVLPEVARGDHLKTNSSGERSFPLIAMQFMLRYLVRCSEFCLICHDKTTETFEALKPYVCSRGLCLFQYMQLGFGPSIEHEILTQPYVVDLLISFCYAAAKAQRIRAYPLGQYIVVPPNDRASLARETANPYMHRYGVPAPATSAVPPQPNELWDVKFDSASHEIVFDNPEVKRGVIGLHEWVVVDIPNSEPVHYRVVDVSKFPTVQLSDTGITRNTHQSLPVPELLNQVKKPLNSEKTPASTPPPPSLVSARLTKYSLQFDMLSDNEKAASIVMLLETLPQVTEMRDYLRKEFSVKEPKLNNWTERVTQPALTLLRWLISSNRSIICQVDAVPGQTEEEIANSGVRLHDKVTGMENHIQFRFAQGAPDKEQRFIDSLSQKQKEGKLNAKCPTLFAWHGSQLFNWHSIIRSGLDYNETLNGRAYGHGCYFSQDLNTSLGYTHRGHGDTFYTWPGSQLQIADALAMAEIVNAPNEFTSKSPHFVVQHVDWIQCRYLFVSSSTPYMAGLAANQKTDVKAPSTSPIRYIDQDSHYPLKNGAGQVVNVPVHAIASRKAIGPSAPSLACSSSTASLSFTNKAKHTSKKQKTRGKDKELSQVSRAPIRDYDTDETDGEDVAFLTRSDESEDAPALLNGKRKAAIDSPAIPQTDFVPQSLDLKSFNRMPPPSYATSMASLQLSRALKTAIKTQNETPRHELGWTIEERDADNLYQWIIELHSFDPTLPLAKDMKIAGVKSVVLEMLFGKTFPMTPPFVRVIRPRFLPFMSGGGGHVTAGGALCMELLTNNGWSAVNTIESVLMQVRLAISSWEPKPARLHHTGSTGQGDYGVGEAMEAFIRACATHGWKVPSDFEEMRRSTTGFPC